MDLLKVDTLQKEFDGVKALDGISFNLQEGTITSLIGPNGAGKTTAFNILTGFSRADKGDVYFNDNKITNKSAHSIAQLGIARTFQNIRIFPQITVLENMMLAPRNQKGECIFSALFKPRQLKLEEEQVKQKALEFLDFVGLTNEKNKMAENLSHGNRKLLELARALATESQLLLLDEPIAGVFPKTRGKILDLLKQLKNSGRTTLFIEHDLKFVMGVSDRIIVLNYGKKIAEGSPEEVKSNNEVIEAYLGRSNATA